MPVSWPPSMKAPPSSIRLVSLIAAGLAALAVAGKLGYSAVQRSRFADAVQACETKKARCEEACAGAHMASCARLAALHETGDGAALDVPRAVELYEAA